MNPNLSVLMDRSSNLELKVAAIYDCLASIFEADPALARFWTLFAEAERYHSLLIQMQKVVLRDVDPNDTEAATWSEELERTLSYLDGVLERLKREGWRPSISEAFGVADHIEFQATEVQGRAFKFLRNDEVTEIVTRLREEDLQHRDKLIQARRRFDPGFELAN